MATQPMAIKLSNMSGELGDTTAMTTIHAEQLEPGDVIVYAGHRHQITRVDRRDGWAWPIAADDTGWAIALDHRLIDVHREAA